MTFAALQTLLSEHPRVAVYLTVPGCAPCHAVRPWVDALFADPAWVQVAIDTEQDPEIAGQLLVFAHPTLILFAGGRERARFSRILRRSEVERAKGGVEALDVDDGA